MIDFINKKQRMTKVVHNATTEDKRLRRAIRWGIVQDILCVIGIFIVAVGFLIALNG